MEINNEVFFGMIYISMVLFSEWTPLEVKGMYGWVYVSINSLMVFSNLLPVIWFGMKALFLFPKKLWNLTKYHCTNLRKKTCCCKEKSKKDSIRVNQVQISHVSHKDNQNYLVELKQKSKYSE